MILIALAIASAASGYHVFKVNSLEKQNTALYIESGKFSEQVNILEIMNNSNIEKFNLMVDAKDREIKEYKAQSEALRISYDEISSESDELKEKLAKNDLEYLARMKPKLIENRMNAATVSVFNNIEEASKDD